MNMVIIMELYYFLKVQEKMFVVIINSKSFALMLHLTCIILEIEYPYKPPSIQMITPNGRFKVMDTSYHLRCTIKFLIQLTLFFSRLVRGCACQCQIFIQKLGIQW